MFKSNEESAINTMFGIISNPQGCALRWVLMPQRALMAYSSQLDGSNAREFATGVTIAKYYRGRESFLFYTIYSVRTSAVLVMILGPPEPPASILTSLSSSRMRTGTVEDCPRFSGSTQLWLMLVFAGVEKSDIMLLYTIPVVVPRVLEPKLYVRLLWEK